MKYAIIAAGEGSRLVAEGVREPKPLVPVGGECLIDRLIRIFMCHGAEEIVCICNEQMAQVASRLATLRQQGLPLRVVVKSTPSSMHSFYEISPYLQEGPFVMTTVDTIFREQEFSAYMDAFRQGGEEILMGVTDYIDDERPLYVETNDQMEVTAFLDTLDPSRSTHPSQIYVSGGIYGLQPAAITTLRDCISRGEQRMRNFQRALLNDGRPVKAWPFTKVLDIDHAIDIRKAEQFLAI